MKVIVDMIVFTIAQLLLIRLSTLAETDRKLCTKSSEELSCLGALVYCFHDPAEVRLVCDFLFSSRTLFTLIRDLD